MAGPVLLSVAHDDPTGLVIATFDLPVRIEGEGNGEQSVLWTLRDWATGLVSTDARVLHVAEYGGDGLVFRLTIVPGDKVAPGLIPAKRYILDASGSMLGQNGEYVGTGAGSSQDWLAIELREPAPEVGAPSVFIGRVSSTAVVPGAVEPQYLNETPEANTPFALPDDVIRVEIADPEGNGIDPLSVVVVVDGVEVLAGGVFAAGFQGPASMLYESGHAVFVAVDPETEWETGQVVTVEVQGTTDLGVTAGTEWQFRITDLVAPTLVRAVAQGPVCRTVQVSVSEPLKAEDPTEADDALNPDNWTLTGVPVLTDDRYIPAHPATVVSVVALAVDLFELSLDEPLTPDGSYTLGCSGVVDLAWPVPNAVAADAVAFQAPGRVPHWNVFLLLPEQDRRLDESGDLRRFCGIVQDFVDLLLLQADNLPAVYDPDLATPEWLDLILADMGNPFAEIDLDEQNKRALAYVLFELYQLKGTKLGIEAAVRFLFDLDPVEVIPFWPTTLMLGSYGGDAGVGDGAELGTDEWQLGPGTMWARFAFNLSVPVVLTAAEQRTIRRVVNIMKRAEEHFMDFIMPEVPEDVDHWELGLSELDTQADLH